MGTDDSTLIRVIVSRCEVDMKQIKDEFQKRYGQALEAFVRVSRALVCLMNYWFLLYLCQFNRILFYCTRGQFRVDKTIQMYEHILRDGICMHIYTFSVDLNK